MAKKKPEDDKKNPQKKDDISLTSIASGAAAGFVAGLAVTRHPAGGVLGGLIGAAGAFGLKSAFNSDAPNKAKETPTITGPVAKPTATEKGNPWSGRRRDTDNSQANKGKPKGPDV